MRSKRIIRSSILILVIGLITGALILYLNKPYSFQATTVAQRQCPEYKVVEEYSKTVEKGRDIVRKLLKSFGSPGMAIAVSVDGKLVWSETFGYANVKQRVPVCPQTRFRIASLSKPITAAAVAVLYERGRLDLDVPIQRYVPSFPVKEATITTRQLLGHMSGIRSNEGNEPVSQKHYNSIGESLSIFKDDPLLFSPGTRFSYSNYGYVLLGAVIEGASGEDYGSFIQKNILDPLAMRHTTVGVEDDKIPDLSGFYEHIGNGEIREAPLVDYSRVLPSGGLVSTAEDLVLFSNAFLAGDILKPQTVNAMFTPQRTSDGKPTRYGLGWGIHKYNGRVYPYHTGHAVGAISCIMIAPKDKVVLAMLSNLGMVTAREAEFVGPKPPDPAEIIEIFMNAKNR